MSRIMKVYAGKEDAAAIREAAKVIEKYDAFLLVEADEAEAAALGRRFPYEDITDQYNLKFGDRTIDTSRPRITAAGTTRSHAAVSDGGLTIMSCSSLGPSNRPG